MKPGIYDISNEQYHASEGISRSAISEIAKSPLHYYNAYVREDRERKEATSAMNFGSAVHNLILEDNFDQHFAVMDTVDGRTKNGKEYIVRFKAESQGKIVIKMDEYLMALEITNEVMMHPRALQLITGADKEKSIYWQDSDTNLLCKARPDGFNSKMGIVFDIKTSSDPLLASFQRSIIDYDYHIQAAMQLDAINAVTDHSIRDFVCVVTPTVPPHTPYLYHLTEDIIEFGRSEYKAALELIKRCKEKNVWDRDRNTVIPVYLLPYLKNSKFNSLLEIYA